MPGLAAKQRGRDRRLKLIREQVRQHSGSRPMGVSGRLVWRLRGAPASGGAAGGVFSRPDGGGRHHGGKRRVDQGSARALHRRASHYGGVHR